MKRLFFLSALFFSLQVYSQNTVKQHVITHNRQTVITDPSRGQNEFKAWGVFPSASESVRKIIMHVTLGCPDSLPCAHWDYLDPITLRRAGGKNKPSLDYELSRMLTPYGSIFTKGWQWTWTADVTDFSPVLRDSVEIEYMHTGWETTTVGWSLTIDFEIVKGPEVAHPLNITRLWEGKYKYGDTENPIEKQLLPINYQPVAGAAFSRIRIQQTGHGMDEPKGCSEFCSRWREIYFDNKQIDHKDLWKNCGDNPLYPQGGTWIYDRALWCPGNLQNADIYDIKTNNTEHSINIKMEPYTATKNIQAYESIASYLIQYQAPKAKYDVALEQIKVPSNDPNFRRINPASKNALIIIRNLGSEPLTSLVINYGTKGFKLKTCTWKGYLPFYQTSVIELPGEIEQANGINTFTATVLKPNNRKDNWLYDNTLTSAFEAPITLPDKMIVQFLSNYKPAENEITIQNPKNNIIYHKSPNDLKAKTLYNDTLTLQQGYHTLSLTDSTGDGLEFWYEPESGYGYLRLLSLNGHLLYSFESDCGDGQQLCFNASSAYKMDTTHTQYAFVLFPRMTKGELNLDVHSDKVSDMEVKITSDGKLVEQHAYKGIKQYKFQYDVGYLPAGRYIIEVFMNGESQFKRRFNKI